MTLEVTLDMLRRARETMYAAEVFYLHAAAIADACAEAGRDELVLAVVDDFGTYLGTWTIARLRLVETDRAMPEGEWRLLFDPSDSVPEIEARSLEVARHAVTRWDLLLRRKSRLRAG